MGRLTGIMDERGKFIFISPQDMITIAEFMRTKGRVSKSELTAFLNQTINLIPEDDDNDNDDDTPASINAHDDDSATHTLIL